MTLRRFAIGLSRALSVASNAAAQDRIISFASVIDGDTVKIHGERIRQFRLAAQLSHPAGYVDLRETPIEAVRREWTEGIGVDSRLLRASRLCCAPSERITIA